MAYARPLLCLALLSVAICFAMSVQFTNLKFIAISTFVRMFRRGKNEATYTILVAFSYGTFLSTLSTEEIYEWMLAKTITTYDYSVCWEFYVLWCNRGNVVYRFIKVRDILAPHTICATQMLRCDCYPISFIKRNAINFLQAYFILFFYMSPSSTIQWFGFPSKWWIRSNWTKLITKFRYCIYCFIK